MDIFIHFLFFSHPRLKSAPLFIRMWETFIVILIYTVNHELGARLTIQRHSVLCTLLLPLVQCLLDVCKNRFWHKSRNYYKLTATLDNTLSCSGKSIIYETYHIWKHLNLLQEKWYCNSQLPSQTIALTIEEQTHSKTSK